VDLQDSFALVNGRQSYRDFPIESTGPEQGGIEDVRPVCRRDYYGAVVLFEAVELGEQLVQRLFPFIVTAPEPRPSMTTN
jgi:hypothetical protein